jgi:hypothetical protein
MFFLFCMPAGNNVDSSTAHCDRQYCVFVEKRAICFNAAIGLIRRY